MIIGMFLGMVMVLGILGVVVMVRMYSDIKKLKRLVRNQQEQINSIYTRIDGVDQMINRRIDDEIRRTDELYAETNKYINSRADEIHKGLDDVYRTIDSRLDKLVTKLNPVTKDLLQD